MKNKEKYAKEIVELACDGNGIAVDKHSGTVCSCKYISCSNCLFDDIYYCDNGRRKWAESEYIEKPVVSKRDRAFLNYLNYYKYIARDMNGELCVYFSKPDKITSYWKSTGELSGNLKIFNIDFPMIKWEDDEPWLIEDLKKLEVVEEYEK